MIGNKLFKNYFNRYDKNDVLHDGFIQSMDLSAYTEFTLLNDLSSVIIDSYLYNELKNRIMLSRWKKFLTWDETKKDFIIDANFYNEAVVTLYVYLAKSEKFYSILKTNFSTLSATELEQINHGSRSTGRVYGEALKTNVYDKVTVELMRGTETENRGTHTDTKSHGAYTDTETHATYTDTENVGTHTDTETKGAHTDTETKGAHTDTDTHRTFTDTENVGTHTDQENKGAQTNGTSTTNSIYPYDAQAFVNDTKSEESTSLGAQQNSTVYGAQSNSTVHGEQVIEKGVGQQSNSTSFAEQINTTGYGSQINSTVYGQQQITNVNGAQSENDVYGAQENTKSFGKTTNETKTRTDTETKGAHTDTETVSAFIDTKSRTKIILLSPDKYFEIQKELAEKNIYTLFAEAINACFLNDNFEFQALEKWGCIV